MSLQATSGVMEVNGVREAYSLHKIILSVYPAGWTTER
jgi:hypothetical protein